MNAIPMLTRCFEGQFRGLPENSQRGILTWTNPGYIRALMPLDIAGKVRFLHEPIWQVADVHVALHQANLISIKGEVYEPEVPVEEASPGDAW